MSWIRTIAFPDATGRLKTLYDRIKGPGDNVDNIMLAHSLRPHTLEGHMAVYKYVLHHGGNTLPKWFLEAIGVWVSLLNDCAYCAEHHFAGMKRLLGDDERAERIGEAMKRRRLDESPFSSKQQAALSYAEVLTREPARVDEETIARLRSQGYEDGQILEINQVAAYFSYANRTVLGLGVTTDGDILGLSPGNADNPDDWSHR